MTIDAAQNLEEQAAKMRAASPPELWPYIDAFLRQRAAALPPRGRASAGHAQPPVQPPRTAQNPVELPPDLTSSSARTKANVQALELVARKRGRALSEEERRILLRYSDWGGLSIDKVRDQLPKGLAPEDLNLSHGYYTPTTVAEAIGDLLCPLLPDLAGRDGIVRALEPSVGTGRLVRALGTDRCAHASGPKGPMRWTTIELSKPSSAIFVALHPEAEHNNMSFEAWLQQYAPKVRGTINLVVCNPPYGTRGELVDEDPERDYRERTAFAYFMRRSLDLLVPGGLGAFLVPAGFLTGSVNRGLRERLLRRHHLAAAYRLPSRSTQGRELFPGASVVVDLLVWRSRGGELARVDAGDAFIVDGRYFEEFPDHVLGQVAGDDDGDDETGKAKGTWRYAVVGDFAGLPPLRERPICETCTVRPVKHARPSGGSIVRKLEAIPEDLSELERQAVLLGQRVSQYLALRAADDDRAVQLWTELHAALESFSASVGNPHRVPALRALVARRIAAAEQLLNAFEPGGALIAPLRSAPVVAPRFTGQLDDVLAQAEALFRKRRPLALGELARFHADLGGSLSPDILLERLLAAGWCLDGLAWDELAPREVYLTGVDLWAKHDRAQARAQTGDEQAKAQLALLVEVIAPAVFEDIDDVSPNYGYVPLDLLGEFATTFLNADLGEVTLHRESGHIKVAENKITDEVRMFVGWLNHDWSLFKPESADDEPDVWTRRRGQIARWSHSFHEWISDDVEKRGRLVDAYNRANRGRIVPTYSSEPLEIARWGADAVTLRPHQIAGARRILANLGGILAFDVGVGKTHTAIAVIAAARQEGVVRRPVVLAPSSLVWKWYDDFAVTLPDYQVLVIGSKRKRISRGEREGVLTSIPDTPEEQAQKWITLQTGGADVVILSYEALPLTRMNEAAVVEHTQSIEAIQRSITMDKYAGRARIRRLSERDRSVLRASTAQWVREMLSLPRGKSYVPGIAWDEIGIDLLVVEEAAAFKNLYMPASREGGIPMFMGASKEGAQRAWQLEFRAAAVRKKNGGRGVVAAAARPAKNSPLEFYNLIQYVNPLAFVHAGVYDPEQFIDRFLRIEKIPIQNSAFRPVERPACVGFKNLDELRTIILTYTEFRTAKEVGIDLPETIVERILVAMNEAQEEKYTRYLAEMEEALKGANYGSASALGLLARLSLVAIHPALDDGYDYRSALEGGVTELEVPKDEEEKWVTKGWKVIGRGEEDDAILIRRTLSRPSYDSPKLTRCAQMIAASPHCGHIVFCEPTASHQWIREVLVEHGISRERIAIMNAEVTSGQDRIRIAREFNGLSAEVGRPATGGKPRYDVVIANSVASEGIDLQVRTCSIHHLDLPWTPADLEQRNGRAVRQGNVLGTVRIYYYLAERSSDSYRLEIIEGKARWLGEIFASTVRDTSNPAAQQRISKDELLLMISRDPDATRRALEEKARREALAQKNEAAVAAARRLRQANARFREARTTNDPELAARLRQEGEKRLSGLSHEEPSVWPWTPWMYAVRDTELLIPDDGSAPLYEGLRVVTPPKGRAPGVAWEFGSIVQTKEGARIGRRDAGTATWTLVDADEVEPAIRPEHLAGDSMWPADDDALTTKALELHLAQTFRGAATYASLSWEGASEAWIDRWWPRVAPAIAQGLSKQLTRDVYPTISGDKLSLRSGPDIAGTELLPPTHAGWIRFLELAKASGHPFRALRIAGQQWWRRSIPQDLLSRPTPTPPPAPPAEPVPTVQPAAAPRPSPAPAPAPRQPVIEPVWENEDEAARQVSQAEAELTAWKRRLEARLQAARISHHSLSLDADRLAKELIPRALSPRAMKAWLTEQGWRRAAEVIDERASGSVDELISKVWAALGGSLPRSKVGGNGQHRIVGKAAIAHVTGIPIVLVRDERGMQPRAVKVEIEGSDASDVRVRPQDGHELRVGEEVYDLARQSPITIAQLHSKMRMLESELRRAPMYLDSLRDVLLSSAILITHWSCRGDAHDAAEQAFERAKEYYLKARQHIDERKPLAALSRAYVSAERLAAVTAQLAEACRTSEARS